MNETMEGLLMEEWENQSLPRSKERTVGGIPTREEILREPAGPRLNAWVAEHVLGLRLYKAMSGHHKDALVVDRCDYPDRNEPPMPYSTDIKEAMSLLEGNRWGGAWEIGQDPSGWSEVTIYRWGGDPNDGDWEPTATHPENNDLPAGICRTVLLAVLLPVPSP